MNRSVTIDCFPSSVQKYRDGYAIVAIDVIRATTMAITAAAMGRRCFVADSVDSALHLASRLDKPLLAGELGGKIPDGFEMNNSPAELVMRPDVHRPLVLLSTSGTKLMSEASKCDVAYIACFRNYSSVAQSVMGRHCRVALIGAGSIAEFREEDQMCCAWIAKDLIDAGYTVADRPTAEIVNCWSTSLPSACRDSNSVVYLRRTGQLKDLEFILAHINDLGCALIQGNEVMMGARPFHEPALTQPRVGRHTSLHARNSSG